jgi:3-dehydroquinate synthetase
VSYGGCSHAKELKRRRAQATAKGSSARTFFSKFTLPEQSYAAALRQDTQQQQPQAPLTDGENVRHPMQQHLPQREIQKTGVSVQTPSSPNNDTLKVATVVQQIMTKLSEAVSQRDKVMIITKLVLNLMKQNGY